MTDQQVAHLIEEFHVPLHVRRHCAQVANFAVSLGEKLIANGISINLKLLRHAALLHDFVRVIDFRKFEPETFPVQAKLGDIVFWKALREKYAGRGHEEVAAEILAARGFHDVAEVVRKHRFLQIEKGFDIWEEKLLYYADKRTMHDQVVTLIERLEDGRRRNMPEIPDPEGQRNVEQKVFELEREILKKISLKP